MGNGEKEVARFVLYLVAGISAALAIILVIAWVGATAGPLATAAFLAVLAASLIFGARRFLA